MRIYSTFGPLVRKILVSVKFLSAILGPEMAAPILWAPGKMRSFCRKNYVHKIPRFRGGGYFGFWGGGGSADFIFTGARIFLGNGRNTVSRVLFRKRELTEFCGKLGEFCQKLGEFAFAHTNNRLRGTH